MSNKQHQQQQLCLIILCWWPTMIPFWGRDAALPNQLRQKHLASLADEAGCQYQIEESIVCVLLGGRKETLWSGSRHVRQVSLVVTGESYCHLNFMFQLGDVKSELADIWIQFKIRHILSCYYLLLVILNLPGLGVFFVTLEQTVQKVCFSTFNRIQLLISFLRNFKYLIDSMSQSELMCLWIFFSL